MTPRRPHRRLPNPTDRQIRNAVRVFGNFPAKLRAVLAVGLLLTLLVAGLLWLQSYNWDVEDALNGTRHSRGQSVSTGFAGSEVQTYGKASDVLNGLEVSNTAAQSTYKRSLYGDPWADIDSNGCDQRNDVLTRDLQDLEKNGECRVMAGTIIDPYTAETIHFERGPKTSEAVPIDHVVALSNAWDSGAWQWSYEKRVLLANDPLNLQATGQRPNTEKSDKSADAWLPQPGYRCEYVARQVSVKASYGLSVTSTEKRTMARVLSSCPEQPAYRSEFSR